MAIRRLTHIGLCVADLERSLRFYRELLGFVVRNEIHVSGAPSTTLLRLGEVDLHALYMERDGVCIELLAYDVPGADGDGEPKPMNTRGLTHLSLRVDDLDETLRSLRTAGTRILEETLVRPRPDTAAVFVCDPDGTLIELLQAPG